MADYLHLASTPKPDQPAALVEHYLELQPEWLVSRAVTTFSDGMAIRLCAEEAYFLPITMPGCFAQFVPNPEAVRAGDPASSAIYDGLWALDGHAWRRIDRSQFDALFSAETTIGRFEQLPPRRARPEGTNPTYVYWRKEQRNTWPRGLPVETWYEAHPDGSVSRLVERFVNGTLRYDDFGVWRRRLLGSPIVRAPEISIIEGVVTTPLPASDASTFWDYVEHVEFEALFAKAAPKFTWHDPFGDPPA